MRLVAKWVQWFKVQVTCLSKEVLSLVQIRLGLTDVERR